jgi:serine/threonine protein kinase
MSGADRKVGRFRILHELGRGGMATVYLAEQTDLGRRVALKELSSFHARDESMAARFLREAQLSGSLTHPNIVTVHEYLVSDGVPYIAMEYCQRGSLRSSIGGLTLAQTAGVIEGVLAGLALAESRGIVHRDLKPENLMMTTEGGVKIADFGIAKALDSAATGNLTMTGSTVGTPHYMAPEQAMAADVGAATDLYSVGIIAFELLTGRVPYADTNTPMAVLLKQVNEKIPSMRSINPDLDPDIAAWVDRMVAKRPEDRPASAVVAWESLEDTVLSVLGPRWRRQARLLRNPDELTTAKPLTPAPFASLGHHTVDAPPPAWERPAPLNPVSESDSAAKSTAASAADVPTPPAFATQPPEQRRQSATAGSDSPTPVATSSSAGAAPNLTVDAPNVSAAAPGAGQPPIRVRSVTPLLVIAIVLLVGGLIAAAVAIIAARNSHSHASVDGTSPAKTSVQVTAGRGVDVGTQRVVLAGGPDGVWLMSRGQGADPGTAAPVVDGSGRLGASIQLAGIPAGIGADGSRAWVLEAPTYHSRDVFLERVDAGSTAGHRVAGFAGKPRCLNETTITCNPVPFDGTVWVPVGDTVYDVTQSGDVKPVPIRTSGQIWDMIYADGAIWTISGRSIVKTDIATRTAQVVLADSTFPGGLQPNHLAVSGSRIWISAMVGSGADGSGGRLVSFDVNDPTGSLAVIKYPDAGSIAGDGDTLWVERFTGHDELVALDGTTGRALGKPAQLSDDITWIVPVKSGLVVTTFQAPSETRMLVPLAVSQ